MEDFVFFLLSYALVTGLSLVSFAYLAKDRSMLGAMAALFLRLHSRRKVAGIVILNAVVYAAVWAVSATVAWICLGIQAAAHAVAWAIVLWLQLGTSVAVRNLLAENGLTKVTLGKPCEGGLGTVDVPFKGERDGKSVSGFAALHGQRILLFLNDND